MQRKVTAGGTAERAPGQARQAGATENAKSTEVRRSEQPPILRPKLFGTPVLRILSRKGGETVGYLYEWDNGERQPLWLSDPVGSTAYAPLRLSTNPDEDEASQIRIDAA